MSFAKRLFDAQKELPVETSQAEKNRQADLWRISNYGDMVPKMLLCEESEPLLVSGSSVFCHTEDQQHVSTNAYHHSDDGTYQTQD